MDIDKLRTAMRVGMEIALTDEELESLNDGGSVEVTENHYIEIGGMEIEIPISVTVTREPKKVFQCL